MAAIATSDTAPMWARLEDVAKRFDEIEQEMADPATSSNPSRLQALAREHSSLQEKINLLIEYRSASDQLQQASEVFDDADDDEMRELAQMEVAELREQIEQIEANAKRALLPRDPNDERNVIIEIRAGAGGDEAGLWAANLYRAYVRYAEGRRWHTDLLSMSENAKGGFKEVICQIAGDGAFSRLKYESGVHRVQRVPETEAQGRIHTSTANRRCDARSSSCRCRHRRFGNPPRPVPFRRRRRPEREQGPDRRQADPRADRHRRHLHRRALAAEEQAQGDVRPARPSVRTTTDGRRPGTRRLPPIAGRFRRPLGKDPPPTTSPRTVSPITESA